MGALRTADVAAVFSALGDETRLQILARLSREGPLSIVELCDVAEVSRQAISKHLTVLSDAAMVSSERVGRQRRFAIVPNRFEEARGYLEAISDQWDDALGRLAKMVEE